MPAPGAPRATIVYGFDVGARLKGMIGIIGAMTEELSGLLESLTDKTEKQRGGFTLYEGTLQGKAVLIAKCGIGKANAAALAQTLVIEGVNRVIFTGVAGAVGAGLRVGDIIVSSDAVQHDVDVRPLGYARGEVPGEGLAWAADATLQRAALEAAAALPEVAAGQVKVRVGRVLSGDQFIADRTKVAELRETFGGACAEMEGAAVAQLCFRSSVPFVIIRSLSDSADGSAKLDFRAFTVLAAQRAKTVVLGMLAGL